LCDNFGLIVFIDEIELFVCMVDDNGGVYVVLVFLGLFVLYWCVDVCGVVVGFMWYVNWGYIVCVVFEVVVF